VALNGYDIAGVNGSGIITTALTGTFTIVKASQGPSFVSAPSGGSQNTSSDVTTYLAFEIEAP
jgi:hypothetical protein